MYVCNRHTPLQTGLKITNRQHIYVSFHFSITKDAQDFIYLTKVILNKNNLLFLPLQFVLAINVKKRKP